MNITKQILFITNFKKADELEKQLAIFSQKTLLDNNCSICEVYKCDEDSSEFLLYMQWTNQESYKQFESTLFKEFEEQNKMLIRKKEVLRLD